MAGFVADAVSVTDALDISESGGWRAHLKQVGAT